MTEQTNTDDATPLSDTPPAPTSSAPSDFETRFLRVLHSLNTNVEALGHEIKRMSSRQSDQDHDIADLKDLRAEVKEIRDHVLAGVHLAPASVPHIEGPAGYDPGPMRSPAKSVTSEVRDSVRVIGQETRKQTPMLSETLVETKKQTPLLEQAAVTAKEAATTAKETQATTVRVEEKVAEAIGGSAKSNQQTTILLIVLAAIGLASQVVQHLPQKAPVAPRTMTTAPSTPEPALLGN